MRKSGQSRSVAPTKPRYLLLFFALFFSVIWSPVVLGANTPPNSAEITLQLRWYHQFQFAGYYAAIAKGFYRDAGLVVHLKEGGAGVDTINNVVSGKAQYGVTNSELLLHRLNGKPLIALASIFQHSPLVFVSPRNTEISTPQDLSGKFVKMSRSSRDIELHATLHDEGIEFDKLILIDGFTTYEDYFDPSIDVLAAYITNQPYYLKQQGIKYSIIKPSSYGIDFYGDCLFTTEDEVNNNPERVEAFRAATLKGWEYALANPIEIIDHILREYTPQKDRDHLIYEAEEMRKLIMPDLVNIGHMNPGRWQHIAGIFHKFNLIPDQYSLDGFLYSPRENDRPTWLYRALLILGFITAIISLATILLLLFNRRLKKEIEERKITELALQKSEQKLMNYARQTEQFSLSAASILSIRDEKIIFSEISKAIVEYSDFSRVLISLFKEDPPYRELIGFAGVSYDIVEKVRHTELPPGWFSDIFSLGTRLGTSCYYIPHTLKHILNQDAIIFGTGPEPENENRWHPEDNLFVRMNDEHGEFIGIISVDSSKSGEKPTDEVVRPLEIYASLISQIIVLKREYTRRHHLEQQLRHAQKMEAIGKLTGGIAHDFNNFLGIIVGNTELAILDTPTDSPTRKNLDEIKAACLRARDIVQHLLTFSRKSGQELRSVNITDLLNDSLNFLNSMIPPEIELINQIEPLELQVLADPPQIYQVLINLCSNAIHAMEKDGGKLTIGAHRLKVEEPIKRPTYTLKAGLYVCIEISDSGTGIEPSMISKIFDPYYTTKGLGQGTGLGLSIVHGIIHSHNGFLDVTSTPGEGTCVTFYLPAQTAPATDKVSTEFSGQEPTKPSAGATLMLVDDDRDLLMVTAIMLEKRGYTVIAEEDPEKALEQISSEPDSIDLLITDMTMPGLTGTDLAARALSVRNDLPVFLCTGYSDKVDADTALSIGIRKYFEKPVNTEELVIRIEEELHGKG